MKNALFVSALAILIWAFFFRETEDPSKRKTLKPATSEARPAARPAPKPEARAIAPPKPLPPAPQPEAGEDPKPPTPPKGHVTFKRIGEFVVTGGDVLIGKPTERDFPDKGFIPIPKIAPWKTTTIAFSVHQDLPNPERVMRVIEYFNANTPIRFVPLTTQTDSIVFAPNPEPICLSYVGKVGGHQPIFLDDRCNDREITHEVMHALGFVHEHSRSDRDNFVRVNWQNIDGDAASQFEIVPDQFAAFHLNRPFDFTSVMMYDENDFARVPGAITLQSLNPEQPVAPTQIGLSPEDLNRLNTIFGR